MGGRKAVALTPQPAGPWPDGAAATAYLGRLQQLLDAKGLDGTHTKIKPLMRRVVKTFQARDFAELTAACDALVDVIENWPAHGGAGSNTDRDCTACNGAPSQLAKELTAE